MVRPLPNSSDHNMEVIKVVESNPRAKSAILKRSVNYILKLGILLNLLSTFSIRK